jgi:predicted glycosyltransferase
LPFWLIPACLALFIIRYIGQHVMDDKMRRRSSKLTKQSFALLDIIKQRKEKQKEKAAPVEENYIEDLYLKIFGKCSPHFNKMETSNEILAFVKDKVKESTKRQIDNDAVRK